MTSNGLSDVRRSETRNPYCEDRSQNPNFRKGVVTILVLVGGAARYLACMHRLIADAVIYLDNRNEAGRRDLHPGVTALAVARGTIGELLEQVVVPTSIRDFLSSLAAANKLDDGLGQWRKLGLLAGVVLGRDGVLARVFNQVFEYLAQLHSGQIDEVQIIVIGSQAGGTGSSLAVLAAAEAERVIVSRTPAPVSTTLFRIGAASFIGCGPRILLNTAAALPEDLAWYTGVQRHKRASRKLVLTELPLTGFNGAARDGFAANTSQATRCTSLQADLALSLINFALKDPMSGITLVKSAFWSGVTDAQLAADVALSLASRIRALAHTPARTGAVQKIECEVACERRHLIGAADLAQTAKTQTVKPPELMQQVAQHPSYGGVVRVSLRDTSGSLTAGRSGANGSLSSYLAQPVLTEDDARQRIGTLGGLAVQVTTEIEKRQQALAHHQSAARQASRSLGLSIDRLWPQTFTSRFVGWFVNRSDRATAFAAALNRWREADALVGRMTCEIEMLQNVLEIVGQAKDRLLRQLLDVAGFGDDQSATHAAAPLVTVGENLDAVLRRMAMYTNLTPAAITGVLTGAVQSVTLDGLAAMVGAPVAQPAAIVRALLAGPSLTAPWYGMGQGPSEPGVQAIVLPKLAPGVLGLLKDAMITLDVDLRLLESEVVCDRLAAVELDIRPANTIRDLFTPQIMEAMKTVRANPQLWLAPDTDVDFVKYPLYGIDADGMTKQIRPSESVAA